MTTTQAIGSLPRRAATFDGFVHREGTGIVDGSGRPIALRGVGLGNWLLPEGYMWRFGPGAESPREIEGLVERHVGAAAAARFWEAFRDAFIAEEDVRAIAAAGFDHVRLPINARIVQDEEGAPIEAGFALIDRLIDWCRSHGLWVLLDLHGAPGGQTGTNIDDSPNGKPELFMSPEYRHRTLELWRELARRYRDEPVVLGYDLLNEPLPNEWQHRYAGELQRLYRDLTRAIRDIDTHHLIMYEGSHWATNWSIFDEAWDENCALQFHKYWSAADTESVAPYLEVRERLQLPIYMGEGGEHNLEWLYAAFRLFEAHGIGWNLWPWKKLDTLTSPVSVRPPEGWDRLVESIDGAPLSATDAQQILDELLEAVRFERCDHRADVAAAVFGEQPAVIPAWAFGFRGAGESYSSSGRSSVDGLRSADGVRLRYARDEAHPESPFAFTWGAAFGVDELIVADLRAGDWLEFEVSPATDPDAYVALDAHGSPAAVGIDRTSRGLRVLASAATTLAWLKSRQSTYPLVALPHHGRA